VKLVNPSRSVNVIATGIGLPPPLPGRACSQELDGAEADPAEDRRLALDRALEEALDDLHRARRPDRVLAGLVHPGSVHEAHLDGRARQLRVLTQRRRRPLREGAGAAP
jgi:hypothetical protein